MFHRYTLEKYNGPGSRYTCPGCGKARAFTRYIDTQTGEHLAPNVGRCSREINCSYHYKPKQYFQEHGIENPKSKYRAAFRQPKPPQPKPVSFVANNIFKSSLNDYEQNNFVQYLKQLFGAAITRQLIARYFIGSSNYWNGATVFWQVDTKGRIRTGKIMLYCPVTGKRVKEPFNHINWAHRTLMLPDFELHQCLFGEHLLRSDPRKPVAIVEGEKTAVIASVYLPKFIWLACGGLNNLKPESCISLTGRNVILYPDLGAYGKWEAKAAEISHLVRLSVSGLLERKASETDKEHGFDLADYLVRLPIPENVQVRYEPFSQTEYRPPVTPAPKIDMPDQEQQQKVEYSYTIKKEFESWELDISELDQYFKSIMPPTQPVRLNPYTTVMNVPLFINSHLATVRANYGSRTFLPYLDRLMEMKGALYQIL